MLRILSIILIVSSLLGTLPAPASAESRGLYLPAIGNNAKWGTVFGTAVCSSGASAAGAWLWVDRWSTVVGRSGRFVTVAHAGIVTQVYYGQVPVSNVFTIPAGPVNVGQVVLPC